MSKRDSTEIAFSTKKEKSAGKISKMQRLFLAGRVPALPEQAAGLGSRIALEMGSSFVVKLSHIRTF